MSPPPAPLVDPGGGHVAGLLNPAVAYSRVTDAAVAGSTVADLPVTNLRAADRARGSSRLRGVQDQLRRVREWVVARPGGRTYWRLLVAVTGGVVVLAGLTMILLPGPGWLTVFLGLGVWSTEFAWAARLLTWTKQKATQTARWATVRPLWLRAIGTVVVLACTAVVLAGFAAYEGWFGLSWPRRLGVLARVG